MATPASNQSTTETRTPPLPEASGAASVPNEPTAPPQRHDMIAEAAFFMAEARGFAPNQELDDWLAAECEVEQRRSNPEH